MSLEDYESSIASRLPDAVNVPPGPSEMAIGLYLVFRQQKMKPTQAFNEAIKQLSTFYPEMTPQQGSAIMTQALRDYARVSDTTAACDNSIL